jgi:hypothetical protein
VIRSLPLRVATWLLTRLLPKDLRESVLGDLNEEYARHRAASSPAGTRWYLWQLCRSVLPLLWLCLTRNAWLSTVAVALLAFLAFGETQSVIRWAISGSSAPLHTALDLLLVFPAIVVIGYCAEWLRPRSALLLGIVMAVTIIWMQVQQTGSAPPVWYRAVWYLAGPAAYAGGRLRSRFNGAK